MKHPRIGVFDSGVGGKSVAQAIERALPDAIVTFVNDSKNIPYGTKTPETLKKLTLPILNKLSKNNEVIVVACNTVSTTIISDLRKELSIPLVALEPMVKPAALLTKSKTIAVCATPTTLASARYGWLKDTYAKGVQVLQPDCSNWTYMIETNTVDQQQIKNQIDEVCQAGADVIVLGCTHYHWIEELIQKIAAGRATILQPEDAVIAQLERVLALPS